MNENNLNMLVKAYPYLKIIEYLQTGKSEKLEDDDKGYYVLIPEKIGINYNEVLDCLRNGNTDMIYIYGLKEDKEIQGLYFTDGNREVADTDSCYFVGDLHYNNQDIYPCVMKANSINPLMGDDMLYMVSRIALLESDIGFLEKVKAFVKVLSTSPEGEQ